MKNLEFSITWDRLNYGEFPTEEAKEADSNMSISFEKINNLLPNMSIYGQCIGHKWSYIHQKRRSCCEKRLP